MSDERDGAREVASADYRAHGIFDQWDKHPDAPAYWFRLPSWVQQYATECVAATERRLAASRPTDAGAVSVKVLATKADELRKQRDMHYAEGRPWKHLRFAAEVLDDLALATPKPPVDEAMREALQEIIDQDDEEATLSDLMQQDRNAGYLTGVRDCANIARKALDRNLTGDGAGA